MFGHNNIFKLTAPLILVTLISGCTTTGAGLVQASGQPEQQSQNQNASADLLAALEGGLIGRAQSRGLSRADRAAALQSEYRALEYTAPGEAVLWQGTQLSGQIIPSQPYRVGSQDCRQYEHILSGGSASSSVKGTACRNPDGSWSLLS